MHQIKGDSVAPFIQPVEIFGYSQSLFIFSKYWFPFFGIYYLQKGSFLETFRGGLILFCRRPFLSEDV